MSTSPRFRITPRRIFIAVAIIVTVILIFTPITDFSTDGRLSTFNTGPAGMSGTYQILRRLKFSTSRTIDRYADTLSPKAIYILADNPIPLSEAERHILQNAVRNGAGLFLATNDDSLAAAFGFKLQHIDEFIVPVTRFTMPRDPIDWDMRSLMQDVARNSLYAGMISAPATIELTKPGNGAYTFMKYDPATAETPDDTTEDTTEDTASTANTGTVTERPASSSASASPAISSSASSSDNPVMLGTTYGAGHVVLLSASALLANQTARGLPPVVATVNALEWMGGYDRPLVFDEYHQGYGLHANIFKAVLTVLSKTPPGWALTQGMIAALLLLAAIGMRPIPPTSQPRIQRRSPLEHVTALANAYTQTDARAFGLDQLIRGLRRRHPLGVNRNASPEAYFALVQSNFPATHDAIEALLAMHHGTLPAKLADAAAFIVDIEKEFPTGSGTSRVNRSSQFV